MQKVDEVIFPDLKRCDFEDKERWPSGRRKCKMWQMIGACGIVNPEECIIIKTQKKAVEDRVKVKEVKEMERNNKGAK